MGTYRLRPYEPPAELSLEKMDKEWAILMSAERKRSQIINEKIREYVVSLQEWNLTDIIQHQERSSTGICRQSE